MPMWSDPRASPMRCEGCTLGNGASGESGVATARNRGGWLVSTSHLLLRRLCALDASDACRRAKRFGARTRAAAGQSGYAVRPARVRREKPRVSAFISADFEKILALEPDLVLAFSDLQAELPAELIRRNVAVHAFNQRDIAGILDMIRTLGALVGV